MSLDLQKSRKRLVTMAIVDALAFVIAIAAAIGAFAYGIGWLTAVFVAAVSVGVGAQIWFIAGLRPGRGA